MTTEKTLQEQLTDYLGSSKPVLVEFYDPTCSKCKASLSDFTEVRDKYEGRAYVVSVDRVSNPEYVTAYKLRTYPTYILFKDGQEVWRDSGHKGVGELSDMIDRFL